MDTKKAQDLLDKYLSGTCTAEEKLLVENWYNKTAQNNTLPATEPEWELVKQKIFNQLPVNTIHQTKRVWIRYAAAAVLLIATGIGAYLHLSKNNDTPLVQFANDVAPGNNKAVLTLANGRKINLDGKNGELAREAHLKISKAGGQIVYTALNQSNAPAEANAYNSIETPNGGQYKVVLPDGTMVWLNAASSLKYPVNFAANQRRVELKGEAYFEVTHNPQKPFVVATAGQNVQVLGTHFNVNAYRDEPTVNTTLLEGKVKVSGKGINEVLSPGQQSVLSTQTNQIKVQQANLETIMAWKNGDFVFKDEDLQSAMRKISRWYNVDVVYADGAPRNLALGGWVSRSKNISAVLKIMELTGKIHFKIEGRRITVMQ